MTIKAILRSGRIEPLEPLPHDWLDGQELVIEPPESSSPESLDQWAKDLEMTTARLPADEHDRFRNAIENIEQESKDSVRREWGLS